MKKGFYIVIAALLVLSLTACGKSKSTNSVPLVDCSDRGSAVEGGCYLMTEETPDEICEEAKVIFSENLSQWVSVFEGDAGEYVLGTPYHTHLRPDNTKVSCNFFPTEGANGHPYPLWLRDKTRRNPIVAEKRCRFQIRYNLSKENKVFKRKGNTRS